MTWAMIIALILKEGAPLAIALGKKWSSGKPPEPADWAELEVIYKTTSRDVTKQVLSELGIPLDSPKALEILNLVTR